MLASVNGYALSALDLSPQKEKLIPLKQNVLIKILDLQQQLH